MVERVVSGVYAGLDLGSTKACVVVVEVDAEDTRVIGVGSSPCAGLRRGVIVDVSRTVAAIRRATEEAQTAAGLPLTSVYAGLSGTHIDSFDSRGAIPISGRQHEVSVADRQGAVDAARTVAIPFDREVLHILAQEFVVDDQAGIREPVGMLGVRLGAAVHLVTGAVSSVHNVSHTVNRAGLEVAGVALAPLAASHAVLTPDEMEMGVCLLDIGGGTTELIVYRHGSVRHTAVIGCGGQNISRDLSLCLRTSMPVAERLKMQQAGPQPADGEPADLPVPGVAGRPATAVPVEAVWTIVEARLEELLGLAGAQLESYLESSQLGAGIVLTGGGALASGTVEVAEGVLERPVRLAAPTAFPGIGEAVADPRYSTAVGLALMAADDDGLTVPSDTSEGRFERLSERMKHWMSTLL